MYSILKKIRPEFKRMFLIFVFTLIIVFLFFGGAYKSLTKMTYIEYTNIGEANEYINVESSLDMIIQEFETPYDILSKVEVDMGIFDYTGGSEWKMDILRNSDGKILCSENLDVDDVKSGNYYTIMLPANIHLEKDVYYTILIYSCNESGITSDVSYEDVQALLLSNDDNSIADKTIPIRLYGCDMDYFWLCFYIFCWCIVGTVIVWSFVLHREGINPLGDKSIQGMIVFAIIFCMLFAFSDNGSAFTDENDNIRGGMIIAKGGILYRDYITQHTPVMYYLCAIFALLGAGSVQQFRLCYYVVVAAFFAFLYIRHVTRWSKYRLALMPVCIIVTIITLYDQGYMIVSDNIQGMCMVALYMEFLEYYEDRLISTSRCIIVSACVWVGFGAAFISVFAISVIFVAVVIIEVNDWKKGANHLKGETFCNRYGRLITFIMLPFIGALAYFGLNNALGDAYNLIYRFNREVYPDYLSTEAGFLESGYGSNIIQPYLLGVRYYFLMISSTLKELLLDIHVNRIFITKSIQLIIPVLVGITIARLMLHKKYFLGCVSFAFMCCNITRGYGFHGLPFWYIVILMILLYLPANVVELKKCKPIRFALVCGAAIYGSTVYMNNYIDSIFHSQDTVQELEQYVVSITEENESVFIDAYTEDSIYLLYKDRYPINRLTYFFPWYLQWYENDVIDDLNTYTPNVLIYNPDSVVWNIYTDYSAEFCDIAEQKYERLSDSSGDDNWKKYVWVKY